MQNKVRQKWSIFCSDLNAHVVVCEVESKIFWKFHNLGMSGDWCKNWRKVETSSSRVVRNTSRRGMSSVLKNIGEASKQLEH